MSKSNLEKLSKSVPIDENMPDLSKRPVVLAKMAKAEKLIAKYGLPESYKKNAKSKKSKR